MKTADVPHLKESRVADVKTAHSDPAQPKQTEQKNTELNKNIEARSKAEQDAVNARAEAEKRLVELREQNERTPVNTATGPLRPAAESSDPTVHKLLAERQAVVDNAGLEPDEEAEKLIAAQKDVARARVAEIDARLESLGYGSK
jgi:hypothetical protein